MDALKFWTVFVVGVTAGACVALIYAPQSGVETRRQIKGKLDDASDYIKDATDTLGDRAEQVIKQGKNVASNVAASASSAADAISRKVSDPI